MAGTLIDQLTVKLVLDVSDFKKGVDEAKKSLGDLKGSSEQSGSSLGNMIGGGAKRATGSLGQLGSVLGKGGAVGVGIGAAIYLAKKLDDSLFQVGASLRQLSIESKNVGQSAAGLRNLQNASVLAGGSLEDATQTVGDLQKSLFDLRFNGQVSDQIVMLSRLGVQFQDSYGRAREFNDVMLDSADALEKMQKNGEMTRPEAFFAAQQAGFTGGMAQIVLSGRGGVEEYLKKQRSRTQVNDKMTGAANRMIPANLSRGQAWEAEVENVGVGAAGNARAAIDEALESAGTWAVDNMDVIAKSVALSVPQLGGLLEGGLLLRDLANEVWGNGPDKSAKGEAAWAPTIRDAAKKHGVPEELLRGVIRKESSFDPNATGAPTKYGTAKGLGQFLPGMGKELGIVPGADPKTDIDASARYLKMLRDQAVSSGYATGDTMPWVVAASAYHAGMSNVRSGQNMGPKSLSYPQEVLRGTQYESAAAGFRPGGSTAIEVNISSINVTSSGDLAGISDGIGGAVRRNIMTAQAETGAN